MLLTAAPPTPASEPSFQDPGRVLWEAQDAYDRGDAARSAASAEAFFAAFPGHPRSADVQFLLAQAREQTGEWRAALEQYRLFVDNYPQHLKRDEAWGRAARLVRRHLVGPARHPITRWIIPDETAASAPPGPDVGVILFQRPDRDAPAIEREVNRFTAAGRRVWIGILASRRQAPFDPFSDADVERVERQIRSAASWPIDGIVIGPGLHLSAEAPLGPAADKALTRLAGAGSADRRAWAWAGMRARRSAAVLDRFVRAAAAIRPDVDWMVAVAPEAVVDPIAGIDGRGQDLAEVVRVAPRAIVAVVDPEGAAPDSWHASLARVGVTNRVVAWWAGRGEIVAWP